MKEKPPIWPTLKPYLIITAAAAIYALAFNCFYEPNQIAYGGITGISQMLNRLFGVLKVGQFIIILNIPLFLLAWKYLGGKLLLSSLYAMTVNALLIDAFGELFHFPILDEPLMACIFGGIILGFALGLVFRQGATTGGTDIIARLIKLKFRGLSMGQLLLGLDLTIITGVSIVFGQLDSALHGIIALAISTKVMDVVLYGADPAKVAYIISDKGKEIAKAIGSDLSRGVTILPGEGAWTGQEKPVLLCAFKKREIVSLRRLVQNVDPTAFVIVCEAYEVMGKGFLKYDPKQM